MRLAFSVGHFGHLGNGPSPAICLPPLLEAERLGYDSAWAGEAFCSDAVSVLAWLGARTTSIDLGTFVMQLPARTPAATAMTAATIDRLSDGRFRLGLGVSSEHVTENLHGMPFADPLGRTREYVELVRATLRRERPVSAGPHYPVPRPTGPDEEIRLGMRPLRADVPLYLAAIGPDNLRLAGEIADGVLSVFFHPEGGEEHRRAVAAGRAAAGRTDPVDVVAAVPVVVTDDLEEGTNRYRKYVATYLGGMGTRGRNFYNRIVGRAGFADVAREVQEHYLAGRPRDALARIPVEMVDTFGLVGDVDRIAARLKDYAASGVTTLSVMLYPRDAQDAITTLRTMVDAVERAGVA